MKLHELEHVVKLYNLGIYFGYPKCCISEFIRKYDKIQTDSTRNLMGSGYVPCANCNRKYSGSQLAHNIEKNRFSEIPFMKGFQRCFIDGEEYINEN